MDGLFYALRHFIASLSLAYCTWKRCETLGGKPSRPTDQRKTQRSGSSSRFEQLFAFRLQHRKHCIAVSFHIRQAISIIRQFTEPLMLQIPFWSLFYGH